MSTARNSLHQLPFGRSAFLMRSPRKTAAERKADEIIRVYGKRPIYVVDRTSLDSDGKLIRHRRMIGSVAYFRDDLIADFRYGAPLPWKFWTKGQMPEGCRA